MENNIIGYLDSILEKKVQSIDINDKKDIIDIASFLQNSPEADYIELDFPIVKLSQELGFMTARANMNETGHLWIGGTTKKLYDSNKVILVNKKLELKKQRYVIANLLANYVLDYLASDVRNNKCLYSVEFNKTEMNKKANYFAMQLLIPEKLLIRTYNKIYSRIDQSCAHMSLLSKNDILYACLSDYFNVNEWLVHEAVRETLYGDMEIEYNNIKVKKKI